MQPIIFHKITTNRTDSTINVQIKGLNPYKYALCVIILYNTFYSNIAIMVKHGKLMMADNCELIKMVTDITDRDGGGYTTT